MAMNKAQTIAHQFLSNRYVEKDITFRNKTPCFLAPDARYDVKRQYRNQIIFYQKQIEQMDDATAILVVNDNEVVKEIPWTAIRDKNEYENLRIKRIINSTKSVHVDNATWGELLQISITKGFRTIGEAIRHCVALVKTSNKQETSSKKEHSEVTPHVKKKGRRENTRQQ